MVDAVSDVQNHTVDGGWLLELPFPEDHLNFWT